MSFLCIKSIDCCYLKRPVIATGFFNVEFMNETVEKRIIAFTSQSLRQYGMRAVRMDDIAKQMNVSKKTIYQLYNTKDKLINIFVETY